MSHLLRDAIRNSTPEERLQALAELAREVFASRGATQVTLLDDDNRTVGYLTRDLSLAASAPLTAEDVSEIRRRMAHPGKLLTVDQFIGELEAGEGGTATR